MKTKIKRASPSSSIKSFLSNRWMMHQVIFFPAHCNPAQRSFSHFLHQPIYSKSVFSWASLQTPTPSRATLFCFGFHHWRDKHHFLPFPGFFTDSLFLSNESSWESNPTSAKRLFFSTTKHLSRPRAKAGGLNTQKEANQTPMNGLVMFWDFGLLWDGWFELQACALAYHSLTTSGLAPHISSLHKLSTGACTACQNGSATSSGI